MVESLGWIVIILGIVLAIALAAMGTIAILYKTVERLMERGRRQVEFEMIARMRAHADCFSESSAQPIRVFADNFLLDEKNRKSAYQLADELKTWYRGRHPFDPFEKWPTK